MLFVALTLICMTSSMVGTTPIGNEPLLELSKRSTGSSLTYMPADFVMANMKNATPMACSDIISIPSIKLVQMTNAQMKAMFSDKGGNYVQDYMAATAEEANNFPNIIILSDPFQNSTSNHSVSVYDNFIAKQVIVDDMQKLLFYLLNKTSANGQPEMGMKINTSADDITSTTRGYTRPLTPSTYPTPVPIYTKSFTKHFLKPTLSPTVKSSSNASQSNASSRSVRTSTAGPGTKSGSTTRPAVTQQLHSLPKDDITTTVDPDVAKSLDQLNKYVHGGIFGGESLNVSARDLDTVWREANTTLHPSTLLGLSLANFRMKRDTAYDDAANDSYTREEYCQMKGALTSDRKYVHLCSSCAATTKLTEDFFPRYINEAICKQDDNSCFNVGGTAHGQCKQNVFSLRIMRRRRGHCAMVLHNGQPLAVDDWQLVHKTISVACECTINKLSVFKQYVAAVG